jgi:hypothetical protein
MKFRDIFLAVLIIAAFYTCFLVSFLIVGFNNIKNNWVQYRCNPMIIPFASFFGHDTADNFAQCVAQLQTGTAPYHQAPLVAATGGIQQNLSALSNQFTNVFGIFNHVLVELHKFVIGFSDMIMKLIGVMTVLMHMMQGQQLLGQSIVKGPIVGALRTIGGAAKK